MKFTFDRVVPFQVLIPVGPGSEPVVETLSSMTKLVAEIADNFERLINRENPVIALGPPT